MNSATVLDIALVGAVSLLLVMASLHDIAVRTIPNELSLIVLACGVLLRLADGTLILSLVGSTAVLLTGTLCWRFGWLGGGDAKLLAASAVAVPPALIGDLLVSTAAAGTVLAVLYLALPWLTGELPPRRRDTGLLRRIIRAEHWRIQRKAPLPYACAICLGALFVMQSR